MKLVGFVLGATIAATAGVAGGALAQPRAMKDVKFSLDFAFGGPQSIWTTAADKGYFAAEGLNLTIDRGGGSGDAVTRVAGGAYDMAWADVNVMIRFNAQNPTTPLLSFYITYDNPPHAVVTLKGRGINSPKDLVGRKVAGPEFDAGRQMFPLLAKAAGIDMNAINFLNVDIRLREATVIRGDADAATGFLASVFYNLVNAGAKPEDVIPFKYSDYGVDLYGSAVFAKPDFIARNPDVVRGISRAISRAITDSIRDPAGSVATAKRRDPTMNDEIEVKRLEMTNRELVLTPNVLRNGYSAVDPARLTRAIRAVAEVYGVAAPSNDSVFTDQYLPPAAERMPPK